MSRNVFTPSWSRVFFFGPHGLLGSTFLGCLALVAILPLDRPTWPASAVIAGGVIVSVSVASLLILPVERSRLTVAITAAAVTGAGSHIGRRSIALDRIDRDRSTAITTLDTLLGRRRLYSQDGGQPIFISTRAMGQAESAQLLEALGLSR